MQGITVEGAATLRSQCQVIVAAPGADGVVAVVVVIVAAAAGGCHIGAADARLHNGGKDEGLAIRFAAR